MDEPLPAFGGGSFLSTETRDDLRNHSDTRYQSEVRMSQTDQGQEQKEKSDPGLVAYLALIDRDMAVHPEHIQPLSADSLDRACGLVGDLEIDPNEELEAGGTLEG